MSVEAISKIMESEMSHLPAFMSQPLASLSHSTGLPSDQIRLILSVVLAIPLGWVHRFFPGTTLRHIVNLLIGMTFCYTLVAYSSLHMIILSTLIYVLVEYLNPKVTVPKYTENESAEIAEKRVKLSAARSRVGYICFGVGMLYMSASHIYRMSIDYMGWSMDFTGPLMILTLKVISYAWNRMDGEAMKLNEVLVPGNPKEDAYRRERAVNSRAGLLEYYGWVFFFPGVLTGPMVELNEYIGHIDWSLYQKRFGIERPPFSLTAPLIKVGYALVMYCGLFLSGIYPTSGFVNTPEFYTAIPSRVLRLLYVGFFTGLGRFKYYFIWYFAEAGCVSSGIGLSKYDKKTGEAEWENCSNCNMVKCEFSSSVASLASNWNIRVSDWLKHTIYLRVVDVPPFLQGKMSTRSFANIATKITSAFWHGFYPGYYVFFIHAWFITEVETAARKILLPLVSKPNPENPRRPIMIYPHAYFYELFFRVATIFGINFGGFSFLILEFTGTLNFFLDNFFSYYVFGIFVIMISPIISKKYKKNQAKLEQKGMAATTVQSKKEL